MTGTASDVLTVGSALYCCGRLMNRANAALALTVPVEPADDDAVADEHVDTQDAAAAAAADSDSAS
eukprot:19136-Heterococcus_DN1.PRE.2